MNTRLDYLWEKVSLFTQFSDLAKIFEPIFFKISLKTGPIFDHPLLVKIGSEIRKSVQNRKTDIFSSPGTNRECSDQTQTARMCMLIRTYIVRIYDKGLFRALRIK